MSFCAYLDPSATHGRSETESMMRLLDYLDGSFGCDDTEDVRLLGWPLFGRQVSQAAEVNVEHDFAIVSPKVLIVGDFKDYGGTELDGDTNDGWTLTTSNARRVPVRGGSQGNPYRQLDKNANDVTTLLLGCMKRKPAIWNGVGIPSFPRMQNSVTRVLLFSGTIEHKTERMQRMLARTPHMHVFSIAADLARLRLLIASARCIGSAFSSPLERALIDDIVDTMGFDHRRPFAASMPPETAKVSRPRETATNILANLAVLKWASETIATEHGDVVGDTKGVCRKYCPGRLMPEDRNARALHLGQMRKKRALELQQLAQQHGALVDRALVDLTATPPAPIGYGADDVCASGDVLQRAVEAFVLAGNPVESVRFPYRECAEEVFGAYVGTLRAQLYDARIWDEKVVARYWHLAFGRLGPSDRQVVANLLNGIHRVMKVVFGERVAGTFLGGEFSSRYAWKVTAHRAIEQEFASRTRHDSVWSLIDTLCAHADVTTGSKEILHVDAVLRLREWCTAKGRIDHVLSSRLSEVYAAGSGLLLRTHLRPFLFGDSDNTCPVVLLPLAILEVQQREARHGGDWDKLPSDVRDRIATLLQHWQVSVEKVAKRLARIPPPTSSPIPKAPPAPVALVGKSPRKPADKPRGRTVWKGVDEVPSVEATKVPGRDAITLIGYDDMKKEIEEHLLPLREPDEAKQWGMGRPGGILLFGPPGCGKTHWAQWIARSLGWPFTEVPRSKFGSMYVDGAMGSLATLLDSLRKVAPNVVFFDEFDSVARDRQARASDTEGAKVVNTLLQEIPKQIEVGNLLIAATNHVSQLDPAVIRPGRFDLKIPVFPPLPIERRELVTHYLAKGLPSDSPLRRILECTGALVPAFWETFDAQMRLFGSSHIVRLAAEIKKLARRVHKSDPEAHAFAVRSDAISEVLEGVRSLITDADITASRAFCTECIRYDRSRERLDTLQDELDHFSGNPAPRTPIGFHFHG